MLNRACSWLLILSVIAMPPLLLTTANGGSAAFYLALLSSIVVLATREPGPRPADFRLLWIAASLPLAATLLSAALHGDWPGSGAERGLRLALGLPLLLTALHACGIERLRHALWGLLAAGWAGAAVLASLIIRHPGERPVTTEYNAVGYGNLLLLFAMISLFSFSWRLTPYRRAEALFKSLTLLITFAAFILTQTRSGWLALPVFVLLGLVVYAASRRPLRLVGALTVILAGLLALGSLSPALRDRVQDGVTQYQECERDPVADTSICIRLQLWRSAWAMLAEHPVAGGWPTGFPAYLQARSADGQVSAYVAENFGEPHNDMLDALAQYGMPGGLALLLLYLLPGLVFARRLHRRWPQPVRAAAAMGLCVCLGFAIFGLSEHMFRGMRTVGLYAMLIALFAALSDTRRATAQQPMP